MENIPDAELIKGLSNNDFKILDFIYANYLPKITKIISQKRGNANDAKDVFQEALVVLFNRLHEPDFQINSSFSNYFYGICKFIWLRQLKKKSRTEVTLSNEETLPSEVRIEKELMETERRRFYQEKFAELGADCRKVLQLFFDGKPLREIGEMMDYTNDYAKRKKYKCKEKLAALIKTDKRFVEHL